MEDIIVYEIDNSQVIIENLYTMGGYSTYEIIVKSNGFGGKSNFCCSIEDIDIYIK